MRYLAIVPIAYHTSNKCVTIQMKALEQYYHLVPFNMMYIQGGSNNNNNFISSLKSF